MPAVRTSEVKIRVGDGRSLGAAMAVPEGVGPFPGVVVLHEAFGLNDDMRRITSKFAEAGYAAIAPDLFSHGNRALCLTRVLLDGMVRGLTDATAADIESARKHLAGEPAVEGERIGVIGFCMGGGFALGVAPTGRYRAASVNYGATPRRGGLEKLRGSCPVIAAYGELDKVMAKEPAKLESYLDQLGVPHDVKTYPGAGHSFMSKDNAPMWMSRLPNPMHAGHDERAAEDNWRRILAFFDEHVRSGAL